MTPIAYFAQANICLYVYVNNGLKQGDVIAIPFQTCFEYAIRKFQANEDVI